MWLTKFSIRTLLITISILFSTVSLALLIVGTLGIANVIPGTQGFSNGILIAFGVILFLFLFSFFIMKFILRKKYKNLNEEEVQDINSSTESNSTSLALFCFLNPKLANALGITLANFRLI